MSEIDNTPSSPRADQKPPPRPSSSSPGGFTRATTPNPNKEASRPETDAVRGKVTLTHSSSKNRLSAGRVDKASEIKTTRSPDSKLLTSSAGSGSSSEIKVNREPKFVDLKSQSGEVKITAPEPQKIPMVRSVTVGDLSSSSIFTKPVVVENVWQYQFIPALLEQNEKNKEIFENLAKKQKKAGIKTKPSLYELLTVPTVALPMPGIKPTLKRSESEESLAKKKLNRLSSHGKINNVELRKSSPRRVANCINEIRDLDHSTSVIVAPNSFVIVFPDGHKKSWVLDPKKLVFPLVEQQCELRELSIPALKFFDYEGRPLTLNATTTMQDIKYCIFYIV